MPIIRYEQSPSKIKRNEQIKNTCQNSRRISFISSIRIQSSSLRQAVCKIAEMNVQKEKAMRDLDTNIYKILDSYKTLLKKSQVTTTGSVGCHDELQIDAAADTIVRTHFQTTT